MASLDLPRVETLEIRTARIFQAITYCAHLDSRAWPAALLVDR